MLRNAVIILATAAVLAGQTPSKKPSALDKPTLEAYLRHLFVWPPPIQMTISDAKPGPMEGFYEVKVKGSSGNSSREDTFYVSKDGQKIFRGDVYDVAQNPFKPDLEKLKTEYQPNIGTPGATVVIAEFSDFECPFCREEAKTLRQNLLATYPKEVRLYYLDYPLTQLHPWAKDASIAGRCVFHQNASTFWDYHDWIFEHQNDITPDNLKSKVLEFAQGKGIDTAQLSTCMDTRVTEEEVNKTRAIGDSLNIGSTPTLFVNGRRLVGSVPWADLKRVIDYEIEYQKTAKNAGEDCGCEVQLPTPGVPKPDHVPPALK